jgi:hypothetical protein
MDDAKALYDFINAPTMNKAVEALVRPMIEDCLRKEAENFGEWPGLVYRGPADFVLQHGVWFTSVAQVPKDQSMPRGYCYGAAINMAVLCGEKYFEGFAVFNNGGTAAVTPHAWNVNPSRPDVVIDRTWQDSPGLLYVGVEFSAERADDATWNGDACVLLDDKRGYPLFKQRWEGEPPNLSWPASERLEMLRSGDKDRARAWFDKNKHHMLRGK